MVPIICLRFTISEKFEGFSIILNFELQETRKINNIKLNVFFIAKFEKLLVTSGGFTSVAAFGTEYSRLDRTKLWKKEVHFTKEAAIA
ncbi:hypothetical protein HYN48_13915 [Flavobacterium magnum]|uniref:Uncharacterized protein n=1 Tax=Flavobacterium magnum TaxID=2162713 RepID=A0A2S0RHJ8_9FLAO|nr:hypothetical protein HYN48_13915 [Flavobacterium magnum]